VTPHAVDPAEPAEQEVLERVRGLCLALPGVTERLSHGEPAFFAGRQFLTFAVRHHDDRVACWAAAPEGAQQRWLGRDDGRFFRPPYVGGRGWIGVYLDREQDWDDVAEIVEEAHRVVTARRRPGGRSG
jgi:hypothetical protein